MSSTITLALRFLNTHYSAFRLNGTPSVRTPATAPPGAFESGPLTVSAGAWRTPPQNAKPQVRTRTRRAWLNLLTPEGA